MRQLLRLAPVALVIGLVVPAMAPQVAGAQTVDQQRQRVEDIVDELERLQEQARQIGEDYVVALDTQSQLADEIVELEAGIATKEAELVELRSELGDMAVRSFVGGGAAPMGPLFEDSENINDALLRDEFARIALSAGDVTTDELDAFVAGLEQDREELEGKRAEAEALAASLVDAQQETERLTAEYTAARADAEARLGELIAEEEARRAAESLARVQAELEAQQAAAATASANAGSSSGNSSSSGSSGSSNSGSSNSGSSNSGSSGSAGSGSDSSNSGSSAGAGGSSSGGGSSSDSGSSSSGGSTSSPPVSSRASVAVNAALGQQGVPYKYATSKPGVSFDCSGLTAYAWAQAGVYLPHQSRAQYASIPHVSPGAAQPGDLIFYYSPISHVGVYLGGGQIVHAPNTGSFVSITTVNWNKVTGVGRPG
ncbi:MAG: NlpC/P60 family protein [Actinomycetota bacterium]